MGDFPDPAVRCTDGDNLWQVGTHVRDAPKNYYLVRWRQPFFFTLVGVSEQPYPQCTVPDPTGDQHPVIID
jgi:hypothetical protein